MKNSKRATVAAAVIGILALGGCKTSYGPSSSSASSSEKEQCYGVAAAGHNDCATKAVACAGYSTVDSQTDAFVALPKGMCERLVGGSLDPVS